jgi:erythromycin esterase-like protein
LPSRNTNSRTQSDDRTVRWLVKWLEDHAADLKKKAKAGLVEDDAVLAESGIPKVIDTLLETDALIKADRAKSERRHAAGKRMQKVGVA